MNSTKLVNNLTKNLEQKSMISLVQKMLNHFETYNFLNVNGSSAQFGFNAENLKEKIKNEWLLTNVVFCDQPSFQCKSLKTQINFNAAFERAKNLVNAVPFSLVEIDNSNLEEGSHMSLSEPKNAMEVVKSLFKTCRGTTLKNQTFCSPPTALEFFHKQQRDCKIWWRKFSAVPGRFHTTKIFTNESSKSQFVEIQAEFPWGLETIELVHYHPEILTDNGHLFEMKSQRKKFIPQIVTCETSLEKIALTYLCDSYEKMNEETDRDMLRFSRKLAPYKVAFAASLSSAETAQNLKDLALLLAKKIRKCGISVLLLPDVCVTSIERQTLRNDALGIPYTILLNDKTLKDGLIAIRSRDTTLKEQSHVSLIVSYIEKLMKNY